MNDQRILPQLVSELHLFPMPVGAHVLSFYNKKDVPNAERKFLSRLGEFSSVSRPVLQDWIHTFFEAICRQGMGFESGASPRGVDPGSGPSLRVDSSMNDQKCEKVDLIVFP
jgi:hypothetical protein